MRPQFLVLSSCLPAGAPRGHASLPACHWLQGEAGRAWLLWGACLSQHWGGLQGVWGRSLVHTGV